MNLNNEKLSVIFDKTEGHCKYCGKQLAWKNYGKSGNRGSWHIDHSNPKSKGGTNYLRNLVPSCINCNLDKNNSQGSSYKKKYEPATLGGQLNELLGFSPGSFGASRRRNKK